MTDADKAAIKAATEKHGSIEERAEILRLGMGWGPKATPAPRKAPTSKPYP